MDIGLPPFPLLPLLRAGCYRVTTSSQLSALTSSMNKLQKCVDFQQVSSSCVVHPTKCLSVQFFSNQSADCGRRGPRDSFHKEKHTGVVEEEGEDGDGGEKDKCVWRRDTDSCSLQAQAVTDVLYIHHYLKTTVTLCSDRSMFAVSGFQFL